MFGLISIKIYYIYNFCSFLINVAMNRNEFLSWIPVEEMRWSWKWNETEQAEGCKQLHGFGCLVLQVV